MFLAHSSSDDDDVDDNELEHAEPASASIEQMVWTKRGLRMTAPVLERFKCRRPSGCGSVFAYLQKSRECRLFLQGGVQECGAPITTAHPVFFLIAITCSHFTYSGQWSFFFVL